MKTSKKRDFSEKLAFKSILAHFFLKIVRFSQNTDNIKPLSLPVLKRNQRVFIKIYFGKANEIKS